MTDHAFYLCMWSLNAQTFNCGKVDIKCTNDNIDNNDDYGGDGGCYAGDNDCMLCADNIDCHVLFQAIGLVYSSMAPDSSVPHVKVSDSCHHFVHV